MKNGRARAAAPAPGLIGSHELPRGEELRCEISEFRGRQYLGIRKWYDSRGTLMPGKGISVPIALLPRVRAWLERAEGAALAAGLIDEEAYESAGLPLPRELGGA
jgi:hypothetical protein